MSFLRPVKFQPPRLEVLASDAWLQYVLFHLRQHRHYFADLLCLRQLRSQLGRYVDYHLPRTVREDCLLRGSKLVRKDVWSGGDGSSDLIIPDLFVPFLFVFYKTDMKQLEIPCLTRHSDRVTVLDLLYNHGTPHGHSLETIRINMFDRPELSIEESYLVKRVLRGFLSVRSLVLWKVCDDAMLQIIGVTCRHLEMFDIWKSVSVTDLGVRMLLGMDAVQPTKLCSLLNKIMIKDTSITDVGAFNLLLFCRNLESLEFSQGSFIKQFLQRIEDMYIRTHRTFSLKRLFFPALTSDSMYNVIKSFPLLEDLCLWTSMRNIKEVKSADLPQLRVLKLGGLTYPSIMSELMQLFGNQLTTLNIETVHFDINLEIIGSNCLNLEQLHIINARIGTSSKSSYNCDTARFADKPFSKLKLVYFFLVQYIYEPVQIENRPPNSVVAAAGVQKPSTGYTALHMILKFGISLEGVQVTGTTALTDSCLEVILKTNPLSNLRRLIISNPTSQEPQVLVPLTTLSVRRLQQSCPLLQCLGDFRYWAITPALRRQIARKSWVAMDSLKVA